MDTLGTAHVGLAIASLASGLAVALARKGTRYHRRIGWVYVAAMLGLNVTAMMIYRLLGYFGPFHVAALFSLATIAAGLLPMRFGRSKPRWRAHHAYWMAGSYVGLLAAATAETLTRIPDVPFWEMVGLGTAGVMVLGAAVIRRTVPAALARFRRA